MSMIGFLVASSYVTITLSKQIGGSFDSHYPCQAWTDGVEQGGKV